MYIGNVHLYNGGGHCSYGIADCDRRVGVCTGVKDNAVAGKTGFLNFSDEFALYVGLIVCNVVLGITLLQFTEIIFETFFSVNAFSLFPKRLRFGPLIIRISINHYLCKEKYMFRILFDFAYFHQDTE